MRYGSQVQRHEPQGFSFILEVPQVLWLTSPMSDYKFRGCKWLLTKHRYAGKPKLVVPGRGSKTQVDVKRQEQWQVEKMSRCHP